MKRKIIIFLLCLSGGGWIHATEGYFPQTPSGKTDSLTAFIQWMDLGEGGNYAALMSAGKHPSGRLAPAVFRDLMEVVEPRRMTFHQGLDVEEGKTTFWWTVDDFSVNLGADTLMFHIEEFFKSKEWERLEINSGKVLQYSLAQGSRSSSFRCWQIRYDREKKLTSGSFTFEVSLLLSIPAPLLETLQKSYPGVFAPEFPASVMKVIGKKTFLHLSYGGTWDRYYIWSAELPCQTAENLEETRKLLIKAILSAGFVFYEEKEGVTCFRKATTDNLSLLKMSRQENDVLCLSFQAYA